MLSIVVNRTLSLGLSETGKRIVKQSLLAQRKRVISWLISVIVSTCSQSGQALRDKLKRSSHDVVKVKDFSKTYELWA